MLEIYATSYNMSRIGITMLLFFGFYFLETEWLKEGVKGNVAKISIVALACIIFGCSAYSAYCEVVDYTDVNSVVYAQAMESIKDDEVLFVHPSNSTYHFVAEYQTFVDKPVYNLVANEYQSYLKYQHRSPVVISAEDILLKIEEAGVEKDSARIVFAFAEGLCTPDDVTRIREYIEELSHHFSIEEYNLPEELYGHGIMIGHRNTKTVFLLKPL